MEHALRRRPVFETLEARAAPGSSFLGFLGLAFMSGALDRILGAWEDGESIPPNRGALVSHWARGSSHEYRSLQTIASQDLRRPDEDRARDVGTAGSVPSATATKLLDAWYDANRDKLFGPPFRSVAEEFPNSLDRIGDLEDLTGDLLASIAAAWNGQGHTAGSVRSTGDAGAPGDGGSPAGPANAPAASVSAQAGTAARSAGASISQLFDHLAAKVAKGASALEGAVSASAGDGMRHGRIEPLVPSKGIPQGRIMPMSGSGGSGGGFTGEDFWSGGHEEFLCHAQHTIHETDISLKDPDPYDGATVSYKLLHYAGDAVIVPSADWIAWTGAPDIGGRRRAGSGFKYQLWRQLGGRGQALNINFGAS